MRRLFVVCLALQLCVSTESSAICSVGDAHISHTDDAVRANAQAVPPTADSARTAWRTRCRATRRSVAGAAY